MYHNTEPDDEATQLLTVKVITRVTNAHQCYSDHQSNQALEHTKIVLVKCTVCGKNNVLRIPTSNKNSYELRLSDVSEKEVCMPHNARER